MSKEQALKNPLFLVEGVRFVNRRLYIITISIGWIVVTLSPMFDSVVVQDDSGLANHRLGFPLPIIEQHTWLTPMEEAFPFKLGLVDPQEHPTDILFLNYFLSTFIVTLTIVLLMLLVKISRRKIKKA